MLAVGFRDFEIRRFLSPVRGGLSAGRVLVVFCVRQVLPDGNGGGIGFLVVISLGNRLRGPNYLAFGVVDFLVRHDAIEVHLRPDFGSDIADADAGLDQLFDRSVQSAFEGNPALLGVQRRHISLATAAAAG